MLTAKPHLLTRRPSPTTAEFTISTSPTLSLPQRILLLLTNLLRLLIGLSVLLLLYSKWSLSPLSTPIQPYEAPPAIFSDDFIWYCIQRIHESSLGNTATRLASKIPVVVLIPAAFMLLYAIFLRIHTTESLLVLRGLGIQTSSSAATYLSTATTRFIPTQKIQDIFINEAFRGFEVRYYLVIVVEGEEEVVVCFPRLLPRRKLVETVWRGVRGCLYEPESVPEKGKR